MVGKCKLMIAAAAFGLSALAGTQSHAAIVTQWTFNSVIGDANTATGTNTPAFGAGTVTLVGGTTSTYAAGSPSDTSSATDNSGLNVTTFPAQSTGNNTAGVEFATSTVSSSGGPLSISLDFRQSGTASRYFQLLVSSDGTNFTAPSGGVGSITLIPSGNTLTSFSNTGLYENNAGGGSQSFVQGVTYTFPAGSVYQNDPSFAFEFVATYDPTNNSTNYISSNAGTAANYGTSGTARFDEVTVSVPEPTSIVMLGLAGMSLLARRRAAVSR